MKKVELLAPGGDPLAVKAAILAGADAVFLGVGDFNARKRAVNITLDDLTELCAIAHGRSCRIYLTFNTLALESEFPKLIELLHNTIECGIDAVILQDFGLLNAIHRLFPNLEIHGSTQMTTHNSGQIRFLAPLGVSQINFSRELSLNEIRDLNTTAHECSLLSEIFVHGAFCVSFSGQCYFSNVLHDNTANRGACVQPCRRSYTTEPKSIGSNTIQPLNLKDNSLYSSAQELIEAGSDSLKIEGRIKGFEYVYSTVSAWREQVDQIESSNQSHREDQRLTAVFNRSFSDNLLKGTLGKSSFTADSGDESLKEVGAVFGYHADKKELTVRRGTVLPVGSSITIRTTRGDFICTGTIKANLGSDRYSFAIQHLLKGKIESGQVIFAQPFLTDGEILKKKLEAMVGGETKIPLAMTIRGSVGTSLELTVESLGKSITAQSEQILELASNRATDIATVKERLGKLGETPFYLASCDCSNLAENLFIPLKILNELRRECVEQIVPETKTAPTIFQIEPAQPVLKQRLSVVIRDEKTLELLPRDGSIQICYQVSPEFNMDEMAILFNMNCDLVPWFSPILIGDQFEQIEQLLELIFPKLIVTENLGVAEIARRRKINWIAGQHLNASNGFALEMFRDNGAVGSFLENELSLSQIESTTIPQGISLWGSLLAPVLFMNSRHCLVRNISDCGKEFMDESCIPNCGRSAIIYDSTNKPIVSVKNRGEYNALYSGKMRWFPELMGHPKFENLLLDLRAPHKSLIPAMEIDQLIALAQESINGNQSAKDQLNRTFRSNSAPLPKGMEG